MTFTRECLFRKVHWSLPALGTYCPLLCLTPISDYPLSGIAMNESVYHDPRSFKPTRYLPKSNGGHGEPLPQAQFGFGRRYAD